MFEKLKNLKFSNFSLSYIERVITHYQTLQTWIGLNVTRYNSLIALPRALPHALPYILYEIYLVSGCLPRLTVVF